MPAPRPAAPARLPPSAEARVRAPEAPAPARRDPLHRGRQRRRAACSPRRGHPGSTAPARAASSLRRGRGRSSRPRVRLGGSARIRRDRRRSRGAEGGLRSQDGPDLAGHVLAQAHARARDPLHHRFHVCAENDDTAEVEAAHLPWQHLGSLLINRGLLTVDQVKQAFEEQRLTGRRLGEIAVGHGWVTSSDLSQALADQFGLEYINLSETEPDRDAATLLQKELAFRYQAVPVRFLADDLLLVSVADPTDITVADNLRLALGHNVRLAVAEPADLERTIKKLYRTQIEVEHKDGAEAEEEALLAAQREEISEPEGETPAVKHVHT